jgi:hypothetical protein
MAKMARLAPNHVRSCLVEFLSDVVDDKVQQVKHLRRLIRYIHDLPNDDLELNRLTRH